MAVVDRGTVEDRLRRIEAVTDSSLAHLDTETLLAELLGRVRESLAVDTATVLLLDTSARQLVAVAAVGIEEEVRQGVAIPVGRGFAGRVAAERRPVMLTEVTSRTVANPLLMEHGLRTLLGVPMVTEGKLVGVLHVGAVVQRQFTEDDVHLLQVVGDRIALVVSNQVSMVERAAATALQRSLLPSVLPDVSGLEFAARYVPGTESGVSGDWYDVFPLPGDRVGLVMGDVVGNGFAAAVVMGRLRSALRAYALDTDDPAEVLRKLDRKATHFEYGTPATVSYAVVDADRDRVRIALAGHLPPMVARRRGETVLATASVGPPIGFAQGGDYRSSELKLSPGGLLCFYTDGLVERRGSTIDDGLDRLRNTVTADPADVVCARVMAALIGNQAVDDDVAVLAMRRVPDRP
jgi:phosphoserine phosphatase RsbU/P